MNIENINQTIGNNYNYIHRPLKSVIDWRGEDSNIGRKIATSAAIVGSALALLIDSIVSLALGVLTSPLLLGGVTTSFSFAKRSVKSAFMSVFLITYFQYENFTAKNLRIIN